MTGNTTGATPLSAFPPIAGKDPAVLILGSMPGVASLDADQYYAHPRNAFWPIMANIFDAQINTWAQKVALIKRQHIALWDVLKECERAGSLDSNIKSDSMVCNDFAAFLHQQPSLQRIVFNGKTAERIFLKRVVPTLGKDTYREYLVMPSTSPAMASLDLAAKTKAWRSALLP